MKQQRIGLIARIAGVVLAGSALMGAAPGMAADRLAVITTGKGSAIGWPFYIAQAKGFFAENGLDPELTSAPSTAAQIQQIVAGAAGLGVDVGLTDPLRAIDKGAKIALIRIQAEVPPYTIWAKKDIGSIPALKGKVIIVGGANDITRIYLEQMLEPNGLKHGDYDMVYAGSSPARYAALASGSVDAAILLPPFSFKAQGEGYSLVARLSDYVKDLPFAGQAVNVEWAQKNKPTVIAFLKAYKKAVEWFYKPENRAEAVDILVKSTGAAPPDAAATYDYFNQIHVFAVNGVVEPASIASIVKELGSEKAFDGPADPARFIDAEMTVLAAEAAK
jgi:NitT/TauT family transport system substrate-binding protein